MATNRNGNHKSIGQLRPGDHVFWRRIDPVSRLERLTRVQVLSLTPTRVIVSVQLRGYFVRRSVMPDRLVLSK